MALAGGGASPEHLTARRLLNAAHTLHLENLRAVTAWDPSVYFDLVGEFEAELVAPFPPIHRRALRASPMNDDIDDALQARIAAVQAMGGEVSFG